jgi:hypothetical protein
MNGDDLALLLDQRYADPAVQALVKDIGPPHVRIDRDEGVMRYEFPKGGLTIVAHLRTFQLRALQFEGPGSPYRRPVYPGKLPLGLRLSMTRTEVGEKLPKPVRTSTRHHQAWMCWQTEKCWVSAVFLRNGTMLAAAVSAEEPLPPTDTEAKPGEGEEPT